MCHNNALGALPSPGSYEIKEVRGLRYWQFRPEATEPEGRVAILTDIYGCNEFYQSFATFFALKGWQSDLIDLFTELGELPELTREAAFERRNKLRDRDICDRLEYYLQDQNIDALIGFCLGGNYVLELAQRGVSPRLVAYYPFPAGLPNQDGLTPPFEYLNKLEKKVTVLIGDSDDRAGCENMRQLAAIGKDNPALDVHLYARSGHGFLAHLDSEDELLRGNAETSLDVCLQAIAD